MITNVRQWNPTALPRLALSAMKAFKSNTVSATEAREVKSENGFFESYEKMMGTQAVLILGIQNRTW
jgi:hypothetical protein